MKIIKTRDYEHMSRQAANIIAALVTLQPDSVLGLATGSSPLGIYKHLIGLYEHGDVSFDRVRAVTLDEYAGLSSTHPDSFAYYLNSRFFSRVNIAAENIYLLNGENAAHQEECAAFDKRIQGLGGVDLQLLGLGGNGHIGFNEPKPSFSKGTHRTSLTEETIEANSHFFEDKRKIPTHAYTMGVSGIMQAKRLLMVVSGEQKAEILNKAFFGPITPEIPASALQFHSDFTLVADEAALSLCPPDCV